ncbi:helix-turn-helix transcriptional regulator [Lentzea sp. BCCO 10_0798]|uniref:Helix-turn-helix transcriptional regulator n=1 Tax=Lentzea kristufekii TaxID=3095430 RepID=A0ABU4TI56_9PSEU|nr:helix-turn-helix transcriptional regulator [Lentzea sp. BCCO 10_0798]MDX8047927.1 helix-turn-helix transcriptional regulator [Lentzea sp. BCCO 10_0798]
MPKRDSTVRGREFGAGIRAAIDKAGLTGRGASQLAGWDPAKLSDLMNGKGGISEHDLIRLLGVCRTPLEESDHLLTMFREADRSGWLQVHGERQPVLPRTLNEHEAVATEIICWSMNLVPGPLQLPDYFRALIDSNPNTLQTEADERVAARADRQQQLFRRRCDMTFYIHEQALRLPVGGPEVMSDQLHHIMTMGIRPYITYRVLPTSLGAHAGLAGSFTLMTFDKLEPVVFIDAENHAVFLDDKDSAKAYKNIVRSLDQAALDAEQSKELIERMTS